MKYTIKARKQTRVKKKHKYVTPPQQPKPETQMQTTPTPSKTYTLKIRKEKKTSQGTSVDRNPQPGWNRKDLTIKEIKPHCSFPFPYLREGSTCNWLRIQFLNFPFDTRRRIRFLLSHWDLHPTPFSSLQLSQEGGYFPFITSHWHPQKVTQLGKLIGKAFGNNQLPHRITTSLHGPEILHLVIPNHQIPSRKTLFCNSRNVQQPSITGRLIPRKANWPTVAARRSN